MRIVHVGATLECQASISRCCSRWASWVVPIDSLRAKENPISAASWAKPSSERGLRAPALRAWLAERHVYAIALHQAISRRGQHFERYRGRASEFGTRAMLDSHVLPRLSLSGLRWNPFQSRRAALSTYSTVLARWRPPTEPSAVVTPWVALCSRPRLLCVKALSSSDRDGRNGSNGVDGWDPSFEIEVPADQRPANELAALKEEALYSWAQLSWVDFGIRLGGLWLMFFVFLGGPIASASFEPSREPLRFVLAGGAGSLFAVAIIVLRLYLGWSYVGNRLLSAVVPYEETGWYDGQLWVKPPEVLARDRLLGAYQVKPVMNRLKQTLIGAAALLATATASLFLLVPPQNIDTAAAFAPKRNSPGALAAETKVVLRKEDLLNLPVDVLADDELAAAAAAAAKGRPVYCTDRYYRALAGGQYCKWEDLRE